MEYYWVIITILFVLLVIEKRKEQKKCRKLDGAIKKLTRQAARWSLAAEQDESPLVNLLHANYGAGYLWALLDVTDKKTIEKVTNVDVSKLIKKIVAIQDASTKKVTMACPQFLGDVDLFLAEIAGNR